MEFGTVIDMEEKVMEEKIMEEKMEGKKYEQMLMEEVSDMLFAVHSMLSSINALCSEAQNRGHARRMVRR